MSDDVRDVLNRFSDAVLEILSNEALRGANPGENFFVTELCGRMRDRFPGWDVHGQYDRREDLIKRLRRDGPTPDSPVDAKIIPDLIVHRIGVRDNLLVVEAKRQAERNRGRYENDVWKLKGLTDASGNYGYAAGVHLVYDFAGGHVDRCDVYVDGRIDDDHTKWMMQKLQPNQE